MSGNSGHTYDPEPPRSPCDRLKFTTHLNSPKAPVIATVKVGDILDIAIEKTGEVESLVVQQAGKTAGSITAGHLAQLIGCIQLGFRFGATVRSISGARVEIEVATL